MNPSASYSPASRAASRSKSSPTIYARRPCGAAVTAAGASNEAQRDFWGSGSSKVAIRITPGPCNSRKDPCPPVGRHRSARLGALRPRSRCATARATASPTISADRLLMPLRATRRSPPIRLPASLGRDPPRACPENPKRNKERDAKMPAFLGPPATALDSKKTAARPRGRRSATAARLTL